MDRDYLTELLDYIRASKTSGAVKKAAENVDTFHTGLSGLKQEPATSDTAYGAGKNTYEAWKKLKNMLQGE